MKAVNQLSLFEYSDYRTYLADFLAAHGLSLEAMARRVGLSKMAVKYLVDKKRHLAEQNLKGFARAMKFDDTSSKYFRSLVLFNKARSTGDRDVHFRAMLEIKGSPFQDLYRKAADIGLHQAWYYPVIAEMSWLPGFKGDPEWIQKRLCFKVGTEPIQKAVQFLKAQGFLNGKTPSPPKIKVPDGFRSHQYRSFTARMIERSLEALEEQPKEDREFLNLTISVSPEKFKVAKKMLADFRHQLHQALADDENAPERVLQVNISLFTLAKSN